MDMHKSGFNNAVACIVIYQRYNDGERNLIRKSQVFRLTTHPPHESSLHLEKVEGLSHTEIHFFDIFLSIRIISIVLFSNITNKKKIQINYSLKIFKAKRHDYNGQLYALTKRMEKFHEKLRESEET